MAAAVEVGPVDGLAAYEENPAHRRAKLAWADAVGAELGEADLRQASMLLDRVVQAVSQDPPR